MASSPWSNVGPYRLPARVIPHEEVGKHGEYEAVAKRFARARRRECVVGFVTLAVPFAAALAFVLWRIVWPPCGVGCM